MELENWPYIDTCQICGEKWTIDDMDNIYSNVTRDHVGSVVEYEKWGESELVTRHTDQTRCLINMSKKLGVFKSEAQQ